MATGTGSFVRCFKSDDTTAIFDGTLGATGGSFDFTIPSTSIATGQTITISSLTFTETQ